MDAGSGGLTEYHFDGFTLDLSRFELRRDGQRLQAEPQSLRLLQYLIENRQRVVTRDDLVSGVWGRAVVSDWAVSGAIRALRVVLGDTRTSRRLIRTVHGKGVRFIGTLLEPHSTPVIAVTPGTASLLVLSLDSIGQDDEGDYLGDGLVEDLITDLTGIDGLTVLSRNAARALTAEAADPQVDLAARYGITHVLRGTLRRNGPALRVNSTLLRTGQGQPVWAGRFDGQMDAVFALQDRMNRAVLAALGVDGAKIGTQPRQNRNPQAYEAYLQGRFEYYLYSPERLVRALAHFERAAALDPGFPEALAFQSYCRTAGHVFAWPGSDETLEDAEALARRAIALQPSSAFCQARLGWVLGYLDRPDEAIECFELATALEPANAEVLYSYGETLNRLAQPARGLEVLEHCFARERFCPPAWEFGKGHSLVLLGQTGASMDHFHAVLARAPRFIPARVQLARALHEAGEGTQAKEMVASIRDAAPRFGLATAARMFPYPVAAERARLISALSHSGMT